MLFSLASSNISGEGVVKLLTGNEKKEKYLVMPVTADRGLCGGFNSSINRDTTRYVQNLEKEGRINEGSYHDTVQDLNSIDFNINKTSIFSLR